MVPNVPDAQGMYPLKSPVATSLWNKGMEADPSG
jgi:hypothetical protein